MRDPENLKFPPLAPCACLNLRKTARAVTQAYDAELRRAGLRATQFSLLATLAGRRPIRVTGLAEAMVMDPTTLSRNLRPLERRGFVRIRQGEDSRVHEVSLTRRGEAAFRKALPFWERAQGRIARALGKGRLRQLLMELAAAREVFQGA